MPAAKTVVEIDGGEYHDPDRDERKTTDLEASGFRVLRIPASETDQGLDDDIAAIWLRLQESPS